MNTKTKEINDALLKRYSGEEWCLMFEVGCNTGLTIPRRRCDAIAMSVWPSRGYALHGHEVKVSRGDFLSELRHPEKSDAVSQYCDFWWLVTPKGLVTKEEIPASWGLMYLTKSGLRVNKQAPMNDNVTEIGKNFIASLLRSSRDSSKPYIQNQLDILAAEQEKERLAECARLELRSGNEMLQQKEWIKAFEEKLGMPFYNWIPPEDIVNRMELATKLEDEYVNVWEDLLKKIKDFRDMKG